MKTAKLITLLLIAFTCSFFTLQAQLPAALDVVDNACKDIVQKNGPVNSTLNGVKPTMINPLTHSQMATLIGQLSVLVTQAEDGLIACPGMGLDPFRGTLSAEFSTFASDAVHLCACITGGDLSGANAAVPIVRSDFQSLRMLASDIRGEIQKRKAGTK